MSEEELNINYIREKTGLVENDELIPIILEMIKESYKAGLCQSEFDNTMGLIEQNQELSKQNNILQTDKEQLNSLVNSCQEEIRQLKKQLEENKNPLKGIFAQVNDDTLLRDCGNMNAEINELKNQQKEFIEYINEKIDICDGFIDTVRSDLEEISYGGRITGKTYIANEIMKNEVAKKILEEILSKYREIIGGDK